MAACVYEQSWVAECSDPWIIPAPTITYRVRKGDTLWRLAVKSYGGQEKAGHRWKQIAKANHLRGTAIHVGQTLRIPRALRNPATGQLAS
jgi:LysM repeat protein